MIITSIPFRGFLDFLNQSQRVSFARRWQEGGRNTVSRSSATCFTRSRHGGGSGPGLLRRRGRAWGWQDMGVTEDCLPRALRSRLHSLRQRTREPEMPWMRFPWVHTAAAQRGALSARVGRGGPGPPVTDASPLPSCDPVPPKVPFSACARVWRHVFRIPLLPWDPFLPSGSLAGILCVFC